MERFEQLQIIAHRKYDNENWRYLMQLKLAILLLNMVRRLGNIYWSFDDCDVIEGTPTASSSSSRTKIAKHSRSIQFCIVFYRVFFLLLKTIWTLLILTIPTPPKMICWAYSLDAKKAKVWFQKFVLTWSPRAHFCLQG